MGAVQPPVQRGRRHQRRPHAMLSQALLGMIQAAGAFQGQLPSAGLDPSSTCWPHFCMQGCHFKDMAAISCVRYLILDAACKLRAGRSPHAQMYMANVPHTLR